MKKALMAVGLLVLCVSGSVSTVHSNEHPLLIARTPHDEGNRVDSVRVAPSVPIDPSWSLRIEPFLVQPNKDPLLEISDATTLRESIERNLGCRPGAPRVVRDRSVDAMQGTAMVLSGTMRFGTTQEAMVLKPPKRGPGVVDLRGPIFMVQFEVSDVRTGATLLRDVVTQRLAPHTEQLAFAAGIIGARLAEEWGLGLPEMKCLIKHSVPQTVALPPIAVMPGKLASPNGPVSPSSLVPSCEGSWKRFRVAQSVGASYKVCASRPNTIGHLSAVFPVEINRELSQQAVRRSVAVRNRILYAFKGIAFLPTPWFTWLMFQPLPPETSERVTLMDSSRELEGVPMSAVERRVAATLNYVVRLHRENRLKLRESINAYLDTLGPLELK
jgi:hypothetical protein